MIRVAKGSDDPLCTRVSLGGNAKLGFYCTYRGTVQGTIDVLEIALMAMEAMKENGVEPPVSEINQLGGSGRS